MFGKRFYYIFHLTFKSHINGGALSKHNEPRTKNEFDQTKIQEMKIPLHLESSSIQAYMNTAQGRYNHMENKQANHLCLAYKFGRMSKLLKKNNFYKKSMYSLGRIKDWLFENRGKIMKAIMYKRRTLQLKSL